MSRPIMTLTTDFGTSDSYVAQMKGVILGINPEIHIVDVTHSIAPQQIRQGAVVIDDMVDAFPAGTIHVGVVDPGVGSGRALVAAEIGRWRFLAPDNGLLSLVAARFPPQRIVTLSKSDFWRAGVSSTFHGRDILAPVAAHWSLGAEIVSFGGEHSALVTLERAAATQSGETIVGEVLLIDRFGNVITSIPESMIPESKRNSATIEFAGRIISGVRSHYAAVEPKQLVALIGSSGRLEVAMRDGDAARELGATVGTAVHVRLT
jgi:S-adenosyl-L-methionine hydrolase (adenosine-forming)